jgi:Ca2+-binding EF-hand superfamily protein
MGRNPKKRVIESKVLIMMILNCIPGVSKTERLQFFFNLYDEEDARIISLTDLKKILQANYFAANPTEVENKARIITEQSVTSGAYDINYDEYMQFGKA